MANRKELSRGDGGALSPPDAELRHGGQGVTALRDLANSGHTELKHLSTAAGRCAKGARTDTQDNLTSGSSALLT